MICNVCVRRLTDCYELKFQIEQSEQLLLSVVSSRLFMGLSNEYSEEQHIGKPNCIINNSNSSVNEFEPIHTGCEIKAPAELPEIITDDKRDMNTGIERKHLIEEHLTSKSSNCLICSKKFSTSSKLDRHLINQHLVRNDINVHKPHQCDECPKSYTTKANLMLHRAVHTGNRMNSNFYRKMINNINLSGVKPFICEICHRGFYKKTSLSTHMSIHTGIRKHLCTICGRSFTSANILQQHKRTHSDVRRYTCSVCSKGFHTSNGRETISK